MEKRESLIFRRQYLITPKEIECPFVCNSILLTNSYLLYVHKDLVITEVNGVNIRLILLGDIFYFTLAIKSNKEILERLISLSFHDICKELDNYTGRFILIYLKGDEIKLVHDCIASRKIYYAIIDNQAWIASQPFLLARLLKLSETKIESKKKYYSSDDFLKLSKSNIANTTLFDEIFHLLPNFYFDLNLKKQIRYFPSEKIEHLSFEETAKKIAEVIKGYLENISCRYDIMLPVTAGKDSRMLLAATKEIKDKVYYYINRTPKMNSSNNDILIPSKLFKKLGLKFHILDIDMPIENFFIEIIRETNPHSEDKYFPIIYNYFQNFSDRINLPGNVAFEAYYKALYPNLKITPLALAEIRGVQQYEFAVQCYSNWLGEISKLSESFGYETLNFFYWEERMGNWGTKTQIDKDIAQEEVNPFNSRLLTKLFLSLDYWLLSPPSFKIQKEVVNILWPEVLAFPINPSRKNFYKRILESMGLLIISFKAKVFVKSILSRFSSRFA